MATIKKAQLGRLVKKGAKAVTKTSDESLDWANSPAMEHYLKNKKPGPNLTKAQQKVNERKAAQTKEIEDSYNTSGPARKVKRKNGGPVPKAQFGKMIKSGIKRVAGEAKAIKSGVKEGFDKGVSTYRKEKFFNEMDRLKGTGKLPKLPKGAHFKSGGKVGKMKNGGSLSALNASNKRVGSVDPKGAYTKVQKKALAGAKGKASLTKDKQLGATKMTAKRGMSIKKK